MVWYLPVLIEILNTGNYTHTYTWSNTNRIILFYTNNTNKPYSSMYDGHVADTVKSCNLHWLQDVASQYLALVVMLNMPLQNKTSDNLQ